MRKLDRTDIGILNSLQENARITNADLARSVNLSPTPCFNRVGPLMPLPASVQRFGAGFLQ